MSISLNQFFSHLKARPSVLLPLVVMAVALGYLVFSKPNKEKLIKNLNSQLRAEKFEQLYEEADESVHLNVTRERFVKRMKMAVTTLKTIDESLAFQRDMSSEQWLGRNDSLFISGYQTLEKDGKSVLVCFIWSPKGKFSDLWVIPKPGTAQEYRIPGISARDYFLGNERLDW